MHRATLIVLVIASMCLADLTIASILAARGNMQGPTGPTP